MKNNKEKKKNHINSFEAWENDLPWQNKICLRNHKETDGATGLK